MTSDDTSGHRPFALPGSSLRYGPDKLVDVLHVDLHLTPDLEQASLRGICTTSVRALDEEVPALHLGRSRPDGRFGRRVKAAPSAFRTEASVWRLFSIRRSRPKKKRHLRSRTA